MLISTPHENYPSLDVSKVPAELLPWGVGHPHAAADAVLRNKGGHSPAPGILPSQQEYIYLKKRAFYMMDNIMLISCKKKLCFSCTCSKG